jgi:hypothetical protein
MRAETVEEVNYWVNGLSHYIKKLKEAADEFVILNKSEASEEISIHNTSVDYITIDLNSSNGNVLELDLGSEKKDKNDSLYEDKYVRQTRFIEDELDSSSEADILRRSKPVTVINSEPRSNGLLQVSTEDHSPLGQAKRVIQCLKTIIGPPPRSGTGPIAPIVQNLTESQIDWLAPLFLALENDDVTEVILHLASTGSEALRLHLICLHASGFTGVSYARASVNTLFEISNRERATLKLVEFCDYQSEKLVLGRPFPCEMIHPFTGEKVDSLVVRKVFSTSARPMMIEFRKGGEFVAPMVLTKNGDDLRVDLQVQVMFRVFNALWELYSYEFKNGQLPYCVTYKVCPFSTTTGVLEVVPRCTSLYEHKWASYDKHRTVSSAIGAFVAGYMLGVRDRHKDNILFSLDTMELFHVDFGYIFNAQTKMFDAPRFAIPSHFKVQLNFV